MSLSHRHGGAQVEQSLDLSQVELQRMYNGFEKLKKREISLSPSKEDLETGTVTENWYESPQENNLDEKEQNWAKRRQDEQDREYDGLVYWLCLILGLLTLLTIIAGFLYAYFYGHKVLSDATNNAQADFNILNLDIILLNITLIGKGAVYFGNRPPPQMLGVKGSLYLYNGTNTAYYKVDPLTWVLALNITNNNVTVGPPGQDGPPGPPGDPGTGVSFAGNYNASVIYYLNNIVIDNSTIFISLLDNNIWPPTNTSSWSLFLNETAGAPGPNGTAGPPGPPGGLGQIISFNGTWSNLLSYTNASLVIYNGELYISDLGPNTGNQPNVTGWTMLGPMIPGPPGPPGPPGLNVTGAPGPPGQPWSLSSNWSSTVTYNLTSSIVINGTIYTSLIANNTNNDPLTNTTAWQSSTNTVPGNPGSPGPSGNNTGPGIVYRLDWLSNTTYIIGDIVLFDSSYYISNTDSNLNNLPNASGTWQLLASPKYGPPGAQGQPGTGLTGGYGQWNATINYPYGSIVQLNDSIYVSITTNNNVGIQPDTNSLYWVFVQNVTYGPGIPGPPGPPGPAGAPAPPASPVVPFYYAGAWSSGQTYDRNAITLYNSTELWIYNGTTPVTGTPPSVGTGWYLITPAIPIGYGPPGPPGPPSAIPGTLSNFVVDNYYSAICNSVNVTVFSNSTRDGSGSQFDTYIPCVLSQPAEMFNSSIYSATPTPYAGLNFTYDPASSITPGNQVSFNFQATLNTLPISDAFLAFDVVTPCANGTTVRYPGGLQYQISSLSLSFTWTSSLAAYPSSSYGCYYGSPSLFYQPIYLRVSQYNTFNQTFSLLLENIEVMAYMT